MVKTRSVRRGDVNEVKASQTGIRIVQSGRDKGTLGGRRQRLKRKEKLNA